MRIKTIVDEDFVNYKKPSMYIGTISCNGKCCKEAGISLSVCQNDAWHNAATIEMADRNIIERYLGNPVTSAICIAGLEPFEQFSEMFALIKKIRTDYKCTDDIVIYTGYYPNEILPQIIKLKRFENIIVKFGRYIPGCEPHFDQILGVTLASDNQFAEQIS